MQAVVIDRTATHAAAREAGARVVQLIRSLTSPDMKLLVPGSEWTVGQTAAHLVVVATVFTDAARDLGRTWEAHAPDIPHWQARVATFNERTVREVLKGGTLRLAHQLEEGVRSFLAVAPDRASEDPLDTPWYGRGVSRRMDTVTSLVLAEMTVHGYDIAKAVGRPWPISEEHARLIISGVYPAMIPLVADLDRIQDLRASYDFRVRGGPRFVVRFDRGRVWTEPFSGQRVDCHLWGDPLTWLFVGYGRRSQWGPIAQGKLRAWGRKPWLGLTFKGLLSNP